MRARSMAQTPQTNPDRSSPRRDYRVTTVRAIAAVLTGRSLSTVLPPVLDNSLPADRARVQNHCFGTLRWAPRLRWILARLQKRPRSPRDPVLEAVLLLGLFELIYTRTPEHAAVSAAVDGARRLRVSSRSLGFVNAVLRQFLRRRAEIEAALEADPVAFHAHPSWLLERIQTDWPADWERILAANNAQAPMTLRVALDRASRAEYLATLRQQEVGAIAHDTVSSAVTLETPRRVDLLPGFRDGLVSVQDAGAQLAAGLLDLRPGLRVLDACAAPGGKTGHILEAPIQLGDVVAVELEPERAGRLAQSLERLGRQAHVRTADLRALETWWDGQPFDRILLDAPCSASGVIRRHPDIKLLRRPDDRKTLGRMQRQLLSAAWRTLAPGGTIIYATCSIFGDENQGVISDFDAEHEDAEILPLAGPWGRRVGAGRQILPGEHGMDGFFYGALRKRPA